MNYLAMPTCATGLTKVRVTFSDSQEAWALLGVALRFAAAAREPILTYGKTKHSLA